MSEEEENLNMEEIKVSTASLWILGCLIDPSHALILAYLCLSASFQELSDTKWGTRQLMGILSFEHWRLEKVCVAYSKDHSKKKKKNTQLIMAAIPLTS